MLNETARAASSSLLANLDTPHSSFDNGSTTQGSPSPEQRMTRSRASRKATPVISDHDKKVSKASKKRAAKKISVTTLAVRPEKRQRQSTAKSPFGIVFGNA
jgi:hypothetical protein